MAATHSYYRNNDDNEYVDWTMNVIKSILTVSLVTVWAMALVVLPDMLNRMFTAFQTMIS